MRIYGRYDNNPGTAATSTTTNPTQNDENDAPLEPAEAPFVDPGRFVCSATGTPFELVDTTGRVPEGAGSYVAEMP